MKMILKILSKEMDKILIKKLKVYLFIINFSFFIIEENNDTEKKEDNYVSKFETKFKSEETKKRIETNIDINEKEPK
tara:strand:- start:262 stop:492 length:231 start_codon:yes stop_codon:yes gene_type:complete